MILIVDDDIAVLASLKLLLKNQGWAYTAVDEMQQALEFVQNHEPSLVIMDMNFSINTTGEEGLDLLKRIQALKPGLPVILMTGWASIDLAIKGMRAGARDFISKPWKNSQLISSIKTLLALSGFQNKPTSREELDLRYDFGHIIGKDPDFMRTLEVAGKVAKTNASILILGESGTGKELIAESIHQNSQRQNEAFIKVNLGGISTSLFESELFGHKKGAFTDARFDRKGRFEVADGGTIFLDEIGELDLVSQVKLLRVLQDRSFEVLGSSNNKKVDIRIISATNRDLAEMVKQKSFREDLFYRINLITIHLPALRERPTDIPLLVEYYLEKLKQQYNKPKLSISKEAMDWLQKYDFPGNIRQLKNLLERSILMLHEDVLEAKNFQDQLGNPARKKSENSALKMGNMSIEEMEKGMISKTLDHFSGNISKASISLGISRKALYRRLQKYDILRE